jgi:hypothetical protein
MKRSAPVRRSPLPPRAKPVPRGKGFAPNPDITGTLKRTGAGGNRAPATASRRPVRDTGFSYEQRMTVRARAGNGDPDDARCEACPRWLGRYGGEVQHRCARGEGGSRLRNNLANAVLLCGSALSREGCHWDCENRGGERNAGLYEQGFWRWIDEHPRIAQIPIMLHGAGGGITVWLDDSGSYLDAAGNIIGGAP